MHLVTGKWRGMYSYERYFDSWNEESAVPFEIDIDLFGDNFTGWIHEDITKGGIKGDISVLGSIDGDYIRFTKSYPDGGHQVYHIGKWDYDGSFYKGYWEIKKYELVNDEMVVHSTVGIWSIFKIPT